MTGCEFVFLFNEHERGRYARLQQSLGELEAEATPRSPGRVREQLRQAREGTGITVTPHDFRRPIATQVANQTTVGNATALLGHADEGTTLRHYVRRTHIAPDLRIVIDQLVQQAEADEAPESQLGR